MHFKVKCSYHECGMKRVDLPHALDLKHLRLEEVLDFTPAEGIIRLHEQRVVILSAAAMGLLKKELIDTLGTDTARRLMLRFGFADGYHDAISLRDRSHWQSPVDGLHAGAVLHRLEGIARVETTNVQRLAASRRRSPGTTRMPRSSTSTILGKAPRPFAGP